MRNFIRRLSWHIKHEIVAFGWPGMLAIGLLVLCGALHFLMLQPAQNHIAALQQDIANLQNQTKNQPFPKAKELNQVEQLAEFYRFFPPEKATSESMAKLYNVAAQQNLNLDQGEYSLVHEKSGKLIRYDIVLPLKASYVQIRKFIAQALQAIPSLSLNSISFNRQKIDETMVDAQLKFSLYLGEN